jgi:glycosyltransferase involved in cell wall biosynthesis
MNESMNDTPLVSVVIPCYRQARYLGSAIESALNQNYPTVEIIVVNDGSDDNTEEVAKRFNSVIYVNQENQGLSGARNTGIDHSSGRYFIFLDADDVLVEDAIITQIAIMQANPGIAFVSGGHYKSDSNLGNLVEEKQDVPNSHFQQLLQGNYIGMHAAVMYDRFVFDQFRFDAKLKAVEDYDLYLSVAAKYPVLHHTRPIAIYRKHGENMSDNIPMMLEVVLSVLRRHGNGCSNLQEKQAYKLGRKIWVNYYCEEMYKYLIKNGRKNIIAKKKTAAALLKYKPVLYLKYLFIH